MAHFEEADRPQIDAASESPAKHVVALARVCRPSPGVSFGADAGANKAPKADMGLLKHSRGAKDASGLASALGLTRATLSDFSVHVRICAGQELADLRLDVPRTYREPCTDRGPAAATRRIRPVSSRGEVVGRPDHPDRVDQRPRGAACWPQPSARPACELHAPREPRVANGSQAA